MLRTHNIFENNAFSGIAHHAELIRNLNACDHNLIIEKLISELKSANGQNIFFSSLFINIARETLVSTYLLHST